MDDKKVAVKSEFDADYTGDANSTNIFRRLDTLKWSTWHTQMSIILGIGWAMDSFETSVVSASISKISRYLHKY